jgi:hypothetical protein
MSPRSLSGSGFEVEGGEEASKVGAEEREAERTCHSLLKQLALFTPVPFSSMSTIITLSSLAPFPPSFLKSGLAFSFLAFDARAGSFLNVADEDEEVEECGILFEEERSRDADVETTGFSEWMREFVRRSLASSSEKI